MSVNVNGDIQEVSLRTSKSIKEYYEEIFHALHSKGVEVTINPNPQEMEYKNKLNEDDSPLVFNQEQALIGLELFHTALREQQKFIAPLRSRKMKPALFWGTFDVSIILNYNRMEPFPEDRVIEKAAFDEHMIEYGFWLGDGQVDAPTFFVLPYPFISKDLNSPEVKPKEAYYDPALSEFFLDMESVLASDNPSETLQDFFKSTFDVLHKEMEWEGCSHYFIPLKMEE